MAEEGFSLSLEYRNKRYNDAAVGLEAFAREIEGNWQRASEVLSKEMRGYLMTVAKAMQKRHGMPWPMGTDATHLSARSGALVQSIADSVRVTGDTFETIEGHIGSDRVYARIQEFGGVIRAKNRKYLAIPLPAALNGSGIPLRSGPRAWDHTFVARSKAGNLLIFRRQGKTITPLFVLKEKVTIPARLGLGETIRSQIPFFTERAMHEMLKAVREG